jgi:teichoic acid transport system ATP-binding protein
VEIRASVNRKLSIRVDDLYLDYEIFEDRRAALRQRLVEHKGTGRRVVSALKGVSFDVCDGESVGIIGSNGSGKTTLLAAIAGLIYPTNGEILVADEPRLLGVGVTLIPTATGWRNIRIGCLALGMSLDELEEKIPEIAAFTELGEALDRPLRTYSSGMRGRLHFAIATSVQPKILLIDEALAVGDFKFKKKSRQRIEEIVSDAGTFLLVSHSLEEVADQCPRVLWIEEGHLRDDGPAEEVIARYEAYADAVRA